MSKCMSRRRFLKQSACTGALILAAPGMARTYGANGKLDIAFIACDGRGWSHVQEFKNENGVALCEPDLSRTEKAKKVFPNAKVFQDYRKMLDQIHNEIDAVVVATPDHHHAAAATRALALKKHVYCEKPLTWSIHEARVMADMVKKAKVATQMGNQGHANQGNRRVVEWIRDGAIGVVKEIHTWTNRPVWPQGYSELPPKEAVPEGLDWDVWCGPGPFRERRENMHPFKWRGWIDYGTGTIGDMGCHTWDCVWWSMDPKAALSCELVKAEARNDLTYPKNMKLKWEFGPNEWRPGFVAYWHDGGWTPPVPEEILNDPTRKKKELIKSGNLFVGTKGKLYVEGDYSETPRLIPESAMQAYVQKGLPEQIPASPGHHAEFLMAAKGEKPWDYPKSNFTYGGPLVEAMLLGCVACRAGGKVEWDPENLKIKNDPKANRYVQREYRKGWELVTG
ncbi:MAG: Gfo/Idh/MocA family oxidoreductase [Planctomycetes bacterium]|nr:Gfo/Idh/MocA family oxidoreductase [Planctomycetota bacterium]